MKITQINKEVCRQLRVDMNEVIKAKLKEYGLEGEFLNGSFDDELVTFKVDIKIAGAMDKRDKKLSDSLTWYAKYIAEELGVDKDDILNKEYRMGVTRYKLIGYNSKAKTYPLIMQDIKTGKKYKFEEIMIRRSFTERVA
tara:strand:+ start:3196 stop:3615 length:420 start_codon:yes stop_codon:yes gene_type:complete